MTTTTASPAGWKSLGLIIEKFFGRFVWGLDSPNADQYAGLILAGIALAATAGYALLNLRNRWLAFVLLYLLSGSIALSVMRVNIDVPSPTGGGPRYFFYPYVFLSWILIQSIIILLALISTVMAMMWKAT